MMKPGKAHLLSHDQVDLIQQLSNYVIAVSHCPVATYAVPIQWLIGAVPVKSESENCTEVLNS